MKEKEGVGTKVIRVDQRGPEWDMTEQLYLQTISPPDNLLDIEHITSYME